VYNEKKWAWSGKQYFIQNNQHNPSPINIIIGIVAEATKLIKQDGKLKEIFDINKKAIEAHTFAWFDIFNYLEFDNINQPIIKDELYDPDSNIVKKLLFLYSLESFVPHHMNITSI
jgi:hypothetical protein